MEDAVVTESAFGEGLRIVFERIGRDFGSGVDNRQSSSFFGELEFSVGRFPPQSFAMSCSLYPRRTSSSVTLNVSAALFQPSTPPPPSMSARPIHELVQNDEFAGMDLQRQLLADAQVGPIADLCGGSTQT